MMGCSIDGVVIPREVEAGGAEAIAAYLAAHAQTAGVTALTAGTATPTTTDAEG